MAGANIFVMSVDINVDTHGATLTTLRYTSGDGQNVTLSPRLGKGHTMPLHDDSANVTLLEGSGVSNGKMTANVRCSNCNSWTGGTMVS